MAEQRQGVVMTVSKGCLVLAAICFLVAAFGVKLGDVNLLYLGLMFWVCASIF